MAGAQRVPASVIGGCRAAPGGDGTVPTGRGGCL